MYFMRMVFDLLDDDIFLENEKLLFSKENKDCILKIERIKNASDEVICKTIIVSYGPFEDYDLALKEGREVYYNIVTSLIRNGFSVELPNDFIKGKEQCNFNKSGLTKYEKDLIEKYEPKARIENEVVGFNVYEVENSLSEINFVRMRAFARNIRSLPELKDKEFRMEEKILTAYSILNTSNLIHDPKIKFLLKVMSLEALVSDKKSSGEVKEKLIGYYKNFFDIEKIDKNIIKNLETDKDKVKKIIDNFKNTLCMGKNKSILEKCRELIMNAKLNKNYCGKDAISFFNDCYNLRSIYVHTGNMNFSEKLPVYDLNNLILDVLDYYENNIE